MSNQAGYASDASMGGLKAPPYKGNFRRPLIYPGLPWHAQRRCENWLACGGLDPTFSEMADSAMGTGTTPGPARLCWTKTLFCLVGLPVRTCNTKVLRTPYATYGLSLLIIVTSVWLWLGPNHDEASWMLVVFKPESSGIEWWSGLITYGFFHGDIFHLAGNLYFLLLFGRHVECRFGSRRFIGLFLLSSMAGGVLHGLVTPNPLVGASGGVFGVMLFHGLLFPRARILWLPFGLFTRLLVFVAARKFIRRGFSIKIYLLVYLGLQVLLAHRQIFGEGNVSALAHLGGALAGALIYFGWRRGWLT